MRTITDTYNVYTFDELSDAAKEKALTDHREFVGEVWDAEWILDDWKERLAEYGYNDADISYSGFWSQGDGASFTATIDLKKWLKYHKLSNKYRALYNVADDVDASVTRIDHMYSHENTVRADIYGATESDKEEKQAAEVESLLTEDVRTLSQQLYRELSDTYDYDTDDAQLIDNIKANEYEYKEDGSIA